MQKRTTAKRACPHDELEDAALLLTMSSAQRGSGAYSMPADHASSHFRECRLSLLAQGAQMQYLADELSWVSSITQDDTKVEDDPLRAQSHPCWRAHAVVAGAASCRAFFVLRRRLRACTAARNHATLHPPHPTPRVRWAVRAAFRRERKPGSVGISASRRQLWSRHPAPWVLVHAPRHFACLFPGELFFLQREPTAGAPLPAPPAHPCPNCRERSWHRFADPHLRRQASVAGRVPPQGPRGSRSRTRLTICAQPSRHGRGRQQQ